MVLRKIFCLVEFLSCLFFGFCFLFGLWLFLAWVCGAFLCCFG